MFETGRRSSRASRGPRREPTEHGYLLQLATTFVAFPAIITATGVLTGAGDGAAGVFGVFLVAGFIVGCVPFLVGVWLVRWICTRSESGTAHVVATGVAGVVVPAGVVWLVVLPWGGVGGANEFVVACSPVVLAAGLAAAAGRAAACVTDVRRDGPAAPARGAR